MFPEQQQLVPAEEHPASRSILIVEDEEVLLELLIHRFERAGFKVFSATSGPEACDQIGRRRPDVVLMDVLLPQLTGLDVLEVLRKHPEPEVAATPVIIVTAQTTPDTMRRSLQLGADSFQLKPYSIADLVLRSCSLIKQHREKFNMTVNS
jgi:DNA-binding response OmpR family regulator